jgi:tRNA-2-methylthio-N6-dimethylallyladenosine synthase
VKTERLARLNELIAGQMRAFLRSVVGRTLPVLIEKPGREAGQVGGRTPYLQAVHMDGPTRLIGQIVPVEIIAAGNNSLTGKIVTAGEPNPASGLESQAIAAHI